MVEQGGSTAPDVVQSWHGREGRRGYMAPVADGGQAKVCCKYPGTGAGALGCRIGAAESSGVSGLSSGQLLRRVNRC